MTFHWLLRSGAQFAFGLALKKGLEYGFDYVLYPTVLVMLGYVWGGVVMTVAAVTVNILIIRAYDWAKVDWLFIEALKQARDGNAESLPKAIARLKPILKLGDMPALIAISVIDDPVTAVLYLRKGSHQFNGMSRRDWKIFVAANVVANIYWTLGIVTVIELFKVIVSIW